MEREVREEIVFASLAVSFTHSHTHTLSLSSSLSLSPSLACSLPPALLPCPPQVRSPDGVHRFSKYEVALAEAQAPLDECNIAATTATVELLEVVAAAAIAKMHDRKIS
eukprot:1102030-Pleurochrysis_carterae.AAC.1